MAEPHKPEEASSFRAQDGRQASTVTGSYDSPLSCRNPDDSPAPASPPLPQHGAASAHERHARARRASAHSNPHYDVPDSYARLDETVDVSPVQNPHEEPIHRFRSLEQVRSQEQRHPSAREKPELGKHGVPRLFTQLFTVSYLILFSIFGTLARLGLQALTNYPGTPVILPSIWPNFAGSLVMGFLAEDRMLFRAEQHQSASATDEENGHGNNTDSGSLGSNAAAFKKTVPLYIGLATGFCGSLTSFSAFMRDMFLALANDLPSTPSGSDGASAPAASSRNGGYSVLALLAVPLATIALSLAGLLVGAHLAIALASIRLRTTPAPSSFAASLPRPWQQRNNQLQFCGGLLLLDWLGVVLGWGCWLGAVLMSVFPPAGRAAWRGEVTFALVFAPLGCLARFFISTRLNGKLSAAFPLGTFVVNVVGTAVLALAWDLAHSAVPREVVGCQLLAGVQDGFCGCLTTVSTWVAELAALRRRHAYVYGGASVLSGFAVAVAVMGGLRWSGAYEGAACK